MTTTRPSRQGSRQQGRAQRMSRALGALALTLTAGTGLGAWAAPAQAAGAGTSSATVAIPVDRQGYVVDTPEDPYQADPSSIHVALSGGREEARSFAHLALDYLPQGATATGATLTMHLTQQSGASNTSVYQVYNVNTSSALVEACPLTADEPATVDSTNAPAYDCAKASSPGKQSADGQTWTFSLAPLIKVWNRTGHNTGLALVPVPAGPADTWSVSYYVSQASADVTYTVPDVAPVTAVAPPVTAPTQQAAPPPFAVQPPAVVAPVTGPTPSAAALTPSPVPTPAVASSAPSPAATAVATRHAGMQSWPWVLGLCLAVGLLCFGLAARGQALVHLARALAGARAAWRTSPQLATIGTVAVVWGLVFSGYSVYVGPNVTTTTTVQAANNANSSQVSSNLPGGGSSAAPGATTGPQTRTGTGTVANGQVPGTQQQQVSSPTTNPVTSEFSGPGTYRVIDGTKVFFPANGGTPVANLWSGADDTVGITSNQINWCTHAATTYGSAFNINASDLAVYWTKVNKHGGIFGRQVNATFQNDNYDPGTAVKAAQACKDSGAFVIASGIGFDQIPAVRAWAEQNHELYIYGNADLAGSEGLRYSFTPATSVEEMGAAYGHLVVRTFPGKKIGIIYRQSPNWTPGSDAFKQVVQAAGMTVVGEEGVTLNQGSYVSELTALRQAGAEVVLAWENELSDVEIIKQAQGQQWFPAWALPPGNLELNTLGSASLSQPLVGIGLADPYDPGYYGGQFASYASDIKQFEADYATYDSGANLKGDGGDLLFGAWEAEKMFGDMLTRCGPNCTRNRLAGLLLAGYAQTVTPNCNINFGTGDHHHAGYLQDAEQAWKDPNGNIAWNLTERCVATP